MDYLDFAVEVSGTANDYRIRANSPFLAPATSVFDLPYDERALDAVLDRVELAVLKGSGRRRTLQPAHLDVVREFGSTLFESLITGDVEEAYYDAYRRVSEQQDGLRIRLTIEPAELASLPWELLYDPRLRDFVCLSSSTPLVRHLRTANPAPPLSVTAPLRILGMVTSPPDLQSLDVAGERDRIEATLQPLVSRGVVEIGWVEGGTWRDLQNAMFEGPWHVFHYVGHGAFDRNRGESVLAFENEAAGSYRAVSPTELGRLIERDHALRLVVLNACEGARGDEHDALSSTAAQLVYRGVPAVLAMQWEISDDAAIEFAQAFYHSISEGSPVDAALTDARVAVSMAVAGSLEWATPVLYMRTPDGQIFDITAPVESEKAGTVREEADTETAKTTDDADPDTPLVDETQPSRRASPILRPKPVRPVWLILALVILSIVIATAAWVLWPAGNDDAAVELAVCPDPAGAEFTPLQLADDPTGETVEDGGTLQFEVTDGGYRQLVPGSWEVVLGAAMTNATTSDEYHGYWRYDGLTVDGRRFPATCFAPEVVLAPDEISDARVGFKVTREPRGILILLIEGDVIDLTTTPG